MAASTEQDSAQDWRLTAELAVQEPHGVLHSLVGRLRGGDPAVVKEIEAAVPHDVVITHDGKLLFAYAASQEGLAAARSAIENVLHQDDLTASLRISHWEDQRGDWLQIDPPLSAAQQQAAQDAAHDGEELETRTLVASTGKFSPVDFHQVMQSWAQKLDLQCNITEHPHLLTTQVIFTVTGPKHKIDEFSQGLRAEGWASVRADEAVMFGL